MRDNGKVVVAGEISFEVGLSVTLPDHRGFGGLVPLRRRSNERGQAR